MVIERLSRPLIAAANVSALPVMSTSQKSQRKRKEIRITYCMIVAPDVYDSIVAGLRVSHEFGKFLV